MIVSGGQFFAGAAEAWDSDDVRGVGAFADDALEPFEPGVALDASHAVLDGDFLDLCFLAVCGPGVVAGCCAAGDVVFDSWVAVGTVPVCSCVDWALEEGVDADCADWAGATLCCALNPME